LGLVEQEKTTKPSGKNTTICCLGNSVILFFSLCENFENVNFVDLFFLLQKLPLIKIPKIYFSQTNRTFFFLWKQVNFSGNASAHHAAVKKDGKTWSKRKKNKIASSYNSHFFFVCGAVTISHPEDKSV